MGQCASPSSSRKRGAHHRVRVLSRGSHRESRVSRIVVGGEHWLVCSRFHLVQELREWYEASSRDRVSILGSNLQLYNNLIYYTLPSSLKKEAWQPSSKTDAVIAIRNQIYYTLPLSLKKRRDNRRLGRLPPLWLEIITNKTYIYILRILCRRRERNKDGSMVMDKLENQRNSNGKLITHPLELSSHCWRNDVLTVLMMLYARGVAGNHFKLLYFLCIK